MSTSEKLIENSQFIKKHPTPTKQTMENDTIQNESDDESGFDIRKSENKITNLIKIVNRVFCDIIMDAAGMHIMFLCICV